MDADGKDPGQGMPDFFIAITRINTDAGADPQLWAAAVKPLMDTGA
jgi:hypothetical protein